MANTEAQMYADSIIDKVERIVACLDGRTTDDINKKPPVKDTNSLHVLAVHTMANVSEAVFEILHSDPVNRDRDAEFASGGKSAEEIRQQWEHLKERLRPTIEGMTEEQLAAEYHHWRRGNITGRKVLLLTATHASEHVGHAEMTRDWLDT
jgi:hypothetical protein